MSLLTVVLIGQHQPTLLPWGVMMAIMAQKVTESHSSNCAIVDATTIPLEINRLCPFALAVLIHFVGHCGVAPEFPFGFFYTMCGWLLHADLHATPSLDHPEWRVRPRVFVHINGDVGTGKTT